MDLFKEKISLGKLMYLLLQTNRFNNAKCVIYQKSRTYIYKVGYLNVIVASGKLAEVSNLHYIQYLYSKEVENFYIKGIFKNKIDIVISE